MVQQLQHHGDLIFDVGGDYDLTLILADRLIAGTQLANYNDLISSLKHGSVTNAFIGDDWSSITALTLDMSVQVSYFSDVRS